MAFYRLHTTVHHPAAMVDIADAKHQVFDYFVSGVGDGRFLQHATPRATAQKGYTRKNIESTDYLECSIGVPIFSKRFVDAIGAALSADLDLHPCVVSCQGVEMPFLLARVKRTIAGLVDVDRSSFMTIEGQRILDRAVFRAQPDVVAFLARDPQFMETIVATEALKGLVEAHALRVGFASV